ncbi:MAG: GNAT family N-acetyltransferase, partial [Hyphomicrobiales bacterium]|nr:GNAT family N-acetyltransferase [Hyphomicrobiales bacterium]
PVAIREGAAFAETVFNDNPTAVDHSLIPTAVFSQPELGTVGLTEMQAREMCRVTDIYRASFRPMKGTLSGRGEKMLMKLIVDGESDRVVGCHIMGPDAGEMIQLAGVAIGMGATKADFDHTVAVHPTAAEELVTMRERTERHVREDALDHENDVPAPSMVVGATPGHRADHPTIAVRPALPEDAAVLARIYLFAWQAAIGGHLPGKAWRIVRDVKPQDAMIAGLGDRIMVATLGGVPVGFAATADAPCTLSELWVEPSAWRRGAGSALVAALEASARTAGCTSLGTDVLAANHRAQKFLAARGFAAVRDETRRDDLLDADVDWTVMAKPLA